MTIRQQPSDFVVRERLSPAFGRGIVPAPSRSENYLVLQLGKESLATPEAIRKLAKTIGVRTERVSYAGLKDKHAQTLQHVSVEPEPTGRAAGLGPGRWARVGDRVGGEGWEAEVLGFAPAAVTAEAIDGNAFELLVRDLSRQASDEMARRADLLWVDAGVADRSNQRADTPHDGGLLIVNYFGAQRFGGARHGQGWIGRALLEGDFERALRLAVATPARKDTGRVRVFSRMAADRWGEWGVLARELPLCPERRAFETLADGDPARPDFKRAFVCLPYFTQQMAVEAYQSYLWNRSAARLGERLAGESTSPLLRSPDQFGEMVFPAAASVPEEWREVNMPVLARKTTLDPRWAWAVEQALRDEGIEQSGLKIPGLNRPFFGEAPRPLFVTASNFRMSRGEPDEGAGGKRVLRRVAFDLPRGAYATVVLRAMGQ